MKRFEDHGLAIDFPAMADFHHEHDEFLVLNITDDAVVTGLVSPRCLNLDPCRASPSLRGLSSGLTRVWRNSLMREDSVEPISLSCLIAVA
jgi:hypothetical protein